MKFPASNFTSKKILTFVAFVTYFRPYLCLKSSPSGPLRLPGLCEELERSAPVATLGAVGDPPTLGALGFRGGPAVLEVLGTA